MSDVLIDHEARERFRHEWRRNFAVSANAGSGKTTAISERLAAMALSDEASAVLPKTAVVTFTKKAAQQIGQRARAVLLRRLTEEGRSELTALDHLERAFFGTIHSFCLLLARRYGQTLGINLNPAVIAADDERCWEEFLEQDAMMFSSLAPAQMDAFLRHVPLEAIFDLAKDLDATTARQLAQRCPSGPSRAPGEAVLQEILSLPLKGNGKKNTELSQVAARAWWEKWRSGRGFLALYKPAGSGASLKELADRWMAPLKDWLADAGAALAAELAERYRVYRFERGVQTYADQVDAALAVLRDRPTLERIRAEGWRVILDEAQDTDPQQFAVLVEITRPEGAEPRAWPNAEGSRQADGPRDGHFCMVGDGQQSIYGSRADIRNFMRHLDAFRRDDGGELLSFHVTFRAPHQVIEFLNAGFPAAFGEERSHNWGLPVAEGAKPPYLQVPYEALAAGPKNEEGQAARLTLTVPETAPKGVDAWMAEEARQVAAFLKAHGPQALGARHWGEICLLAPRNSWLITVQKVFEAAGLKVALQTRKNRNGDNPVYGWMAGLMAVVCDPENAFEWFGVLRDVFAISDAKLADELREHDAFLWESPEEHGAEIAAALEKLRPWILRADDEGLPLGAMARGLVDVCRLEEKARALDESGGLSDELARLLARAAELGLEGAGAREWLTELLNDLDEGKPSGKPEEGAVNLLTSHSAKGLEWPVVIALGLWRKISSKEDAGLRLVRDDGGRMRVYFDGASLSDETKESRRREQWRELTRLMYVTLTRPRRRLILPWAVGFGVGQKGGGVSFGELWGDDTSWGRLPEAAASSDEGEVVEAVPSKEGEDVSALKSVTPAEVLPASTNDDVVAALAVAPMPRRVLPHQLAEKAADRVRGIRHESSAELVSAARSDGDEAIDYGLWWHETMEFMPWGRASADVAEHIAAALKAAEPLGFAERGAKELALLQAGAAWLELNDARWMWQAELAVFAPLEADAWMDGVVDMVLHDPVAQELRVLDWKTNRRRASELSSEMLIRLREEYRPQLAAYGRAMAGFFPGCQVKLLVYASGLGEWIEVGAD
ncbi:MAG: UvrD-helicase domain-containing protein [Nibricoccus sp.]